MEQMGGLNGRLSLFCGDDDSEHEIKSSVFNLSYNSSLPNVSTCDQNTIFTWIPCCVVCFMCVAWLVCLTRRPTTHIRRSYYNIFKLVICFLLFIINLVNLIRSSVGPHSSTPYIITKYAVRAIAVILLTFVMWYEYKKRIHSSGVVSISWLMMMIFGLMELRSRIIESGHDPFQTYTFFISFLLILIELFCCFFADLSALKVVSDSLKVNQFEGHPKATDAKAMKQCPEERACFFSQLFFFWISGLMWNGYRRLLTVNDLYDLREVDRTEVIVMAFDTFWHEEVDRVYKKYGHEGSKHIASSNDIANNNKSKLLNNNNNVNVDNERVQMLPLPKEGSDLPTQITKNNEVTLSKRNVSMMRVLFKMFGSHYMFGGVLKLMNDLTAFLLPILLNYMITFIKSRNSPMWIGMVLVVMMLLVSFMRTLLIQQYWNVCYVVGQHIRTAIIGMVYRKALKLNNTARRTTTVGEIVNLMSVDAQKFDDASPFIHMIWSTPVTISISIYMLWQFLGPSVLAGLLCMLIMIPINGFIATKTKRLQVDQMKFKDSRIKMITEILNGIKVLKLYSWEEYFLKNVSSIRAKEIKVLRTAQILSAASAISWFMTPFFVALSTFAVYVLSSPDNVLDANKAFVSLSLFNMLNYPISILPMVINSIIQVAVSTKRLKRFLLEKELNKYIVTDGCLDPNNAIEIKDCSFAWGEDDDYVLKNINLFIPKGKLVAIVGQVGSGKSSLISALCGEMDVAKGGVRVKGSIAYVAQLGWIQNATIKDNILFSRRFSKSTYEEIIDACALRPDFQVLPGADLTEVGEKGINLSGGQKQRVSLARALYQNADIYLLDDPLSAVDTHVGEHIFNKVIGNNGLLKKKTRILVTNQVSFLPQMDLIVVIKDSVISEIGTYKELVARRTPFTEFVQQHLNHHDDDDDDVIIHKIRTSSNTPSESTPLTRHSIRRNLVSQASSKSEAIESAKLMTEEATMTGNVKLSVLLRYIRSSRVYPAIIFMFFYVFFLVTQTSANLWLSVWSNDPPSNDTSTRHYRISVYGGFGFAQTIGVVGMSISLAYLCTRSSENLHSILLGSILRAPMSFFDTTPQGRIINRFSRDVDILDVTIPITLRIWFATFAGVISTFFVISYTMPIFLVAGLPLALFYYFVQRFYICTSRQLRRLDSNFRSPIYTHFSETIVGCNSIRAYGHQGRFIKTSNELIDRSLMTNYPIIISNRWLGVLVESVGIATLVLAGLFAVLQKDYIDAGLAGLSLSYAIQITLTLNMFVRMTSELETNIVAVERIDEYIGCPHEAPIHTSVVLPPSWPDTGLVEFNNYSTRYRDNLDLALKNFSCTFNPGEKVGIVGRTGAGKSSMALALFRIIEASEGSINIDNIQISTLGLNDLRSRLTIIPQDPVLFSGTLRMNIDPSGSKVDSEIWEVLRHASLHDFVFNLPEKLLTTCSEGGSNLSVGQRQLVCLARALLRKTNILVLDEATAAIDLQSDAFIQMTIRNEFIKCTVITIAHRLNTIIDYDKILVLEEGRLVEFDSPRNLLANNSSKFYNMAKSANLVK